MQNEPEKKIEEKVSVWLQEKIAENNDTLDLSDNFLTTADENYLIRVLKTNTRIRHLDLGRTYIEPSQVKSIIDVIGAENKTLTSISFNETNIDTDAAIILVQNPQLTDIDIGEIIDQNDITSARRIIDALTKRTAPLNTLTLSEFPWDEKLMQQFVTWLPKSGISSLDIADHHEVGVLFDDYGKDFTDVFTAAVTLTFLQFLAKDKCLISVEAMNILTPLITEQNSTRHKKVLENITTALNDIANKNTTLRTFKITCYSNDDQQELEQWPSLKDAIGDVTEKFKPVEKASLSDGYDNFSFLNFSSQNPLKRKKTDTPIDDTTPKIPKIS